MKKKISLFLVISMTLLAFAAPAYAAEPEESAGGEVYSEAVEGEPASEVVIPIYIRNNPGLKGYTLQFFYDPAFMAPIEVERGDVLAEGNFNDNIEGTTSTENSFKVVWNSGVESTENGLLFSIRFLLNPKAGGRSDIQIGYDAGDTYNGDYEGVELDLSTIVVTTQGDSNILRLPEDIIRIEEYAFIGIKASAVYLPDTCTYIGNGAFSNSSVKQIHIPADCVLGEDVFDGCEKVIIYGKSGSEAESYCDAHTNCTFVEE